MFPFVCVYVCVCVCVSVCVVETVWACVAGISWGLYQNFHSSYNQMSKDNTDGQGGFCKDCTNRQGFCKDNTHCVCILR